MTWSVVKNALDWAKSPPASSAPPSIENHATGYRTCIYYGSWSPYRNHMPQDIPVQHTTNIFYCFFNVDGDTGAVTLGDNWGDVEKPYPSLVVPRTHYKGAFARFFEIKRSFRRVKISMSIGGWSNRTNFSKGMSTDEKVDRFVETAIGHMMEYGFDGIDLDWEYPEDRVEAQRYLDVMVKLRTAMREIECKRSILKDSLLLTIACPAFAEKLNLFNVKAMNEQLSFWNMMTYDFAGDWSDTAGYHCNLFKVRQSLLCGDDAIKYMLKRGIEPSKLTLGMANYGRSFANTKGYGHDFHGVHPSSDNGIFNYNKLPLPHYKEMYDEEAVSAYCYSAKDKVFISYDNKDSIKKKAEYVLENNLGGGMWWESMGDNYRHPEHSLLHTFVYHIRGVEENPRPMDTSKNIIGIYTESEYLKKQVPYALTDDEDCPGTSFV